MWDAGVALCDWLCARPGRVCGKRVVELGAGTGLVGLVCGLLGAAQVSEKDNKSAQVGPSPAFYRCVPTGMHGPTCIFWANLTDFSLWG